MTTLSNTSAQHLRQFIEQIERLEEEKRATGADIKNKYAEAKAVGFDVETMKKIVKLRTKSKTEREEEESVLEVYMHALGMLDGTPMGEYIDKLDATDRLSEMAREDGAPEPTISINGGPPHPMSVVREAVEIVKRTKSRVPA